MPNIVFNYHQKLADHFQKQKKTWDWFSSSKVKQEQRTEHKNSLLKNTYRLSNDSEKNIYELVEIAKTKLGITKTVTIYQELESTHTNASITFDGEEIHLIVSGTLIDKLEKQELLAVIGHELSHILFYETENGRYEITNRIITSIANDGRSESVMIETARLYRLYMELYCDRGAMLVVDDLHTVIRALVKISTGLNQVSAENYLKQAKEIFQQENFGSSGQTHPETFIRAVALDYWQNKKEEKEITELIDASWGMSKLDIFKQAQLNVETKKLLRLVTKPKWIRTELVFSLCRQYYPDFTYQDDLVIDEELTKILSQVDDTVKEYFSYLLLDFCFIDSSLESAPIGHTFQIAEALEFPKTFRQILKKERQLTSKDLENVIKKGVIEVSEINESADESVLRDE